MSAGSQQPEGGSRPAAASPGAALPHVSAEPERTAEPGPFSAAYRATSLGVVGLVSVVAFEAMGSATVMPAAATAHGGLSVYGFLFGGPLAVSLLGMVLAGHWSDRDGPLRAVRIGIACFVAGLLVASMSNSVWMLLSGRLATGLGSGMVSVALYAMVGRVYPANLHSRIFAAFAAAWMLPALIGPALAGAMSGWLGWRYAMLTPAALALPAYLLLAGVPASSPASRASTRGGDPRNRLAWAAGASLGAVVLHLVGQARPGGIDGFRPSFAATFLLAAAVALLVVSARRLLPQGSLTAERGLPAAIALSGLSQGAFFAAEAFLPLLLHREKGASVALAGLLLSAGAVTWSAGACVRSRIHSRVSVARLLRCGFALLGSGIAVSMLVLLPAAPIGVALVGWTVAGAGMGLVSPTLSVVTLALASPDAQGHVGASLRLSAALATTATLALSGATFALLLHVNAAGAYAASLGIAVLLALLGVIRAGRVTVTASE